MTKPPSLRNALKAETADLHEQIEETSLMSRLLEADLSIPEYEKFLQVMYHFYAHVETQLDQMEALEQILPDLAMRMKSRSLKLDLQDFNLEPRPTAQLAPIELPIQNISQAMGVMYVLEGSTLGGQFIKKELLKRDFLKDQPLQFFTHYGTEVGLFWRKFLQALELSEAEKKVDNEVVITAARETFAQMMRQLERA